MSKLKYAFSKEFTGCTGKNIHPTTFKAGDPVPDDLVEAAKEKGVLEANKKAAGNSKKTPAANKKAAGNSKK